MVSERIEPCALCQEMVPGRSMVYLLVIPSEIGWQLGGGSSRVSQFIACCYSNWSRLTSCATD